MKLEDANKRLSNVKLRVKGNRIYLRATLPNKHNSDKSKQYELSTGLPNTTEGIKVALARAQKLESDLILDRFSWSDWGIREESSPILIEEAIADFEKQYWEHHSRTKGREQNFKTDYLKPFTFLPPDEPLEEAVLKRVLLRFDPSSRDRLRCHMAFKALANSAGVQLSSNWSKLKGEYQPNQDRKIPTDTEIEAIRDSIKNPSWQWVFGILATYGLRPHEVWHLDFSEMPILKILQSTKTGARLAFPVPKLWVDNWLLSVPLYPNINPENRTNRELGQRISHYFGKNHLGIVPYDLRHAYAIRCAIASINPVFVAEWMGHSLAVHTKAYLRFLSQANHQAAWDKIDWEILGKPKNER